MMRSLENYDARAEEIRLSSLERTMRNAEVRSMAEQAALSSHPVVPYVLHLPVQSPLYPANRYLRFANAVNKDTGEFVDAESLRKVHHQEGQERHEGHEVLVSQEDHESPEGITHEADHDHIIDPQTEFETVLVTPTGKETSEAIIHTRLQERIRNHITWDMPGHDLQRPIDKGCGIIRASDKTIVYTACPEDHHHHCKAKCKHCWSLRCPKCMNDTALKKAVAVEKRMLEFKMLNQKQGIDVGDVSHWVVSPPQDFMKSAMQSFEPFDEVNRYIEAQLVRNGGFAGFNVFHPWRQSWKKNIGQFWELSPHFHIIMYGRIDTDQFRKDNPGWIIKKIHSRQRIRSIRHTVAYLMTHMGLGYVDVEPEDVDWDLDILDHFIPGLKSPGAKFKDGDYEDELKGKGRMVGDLSDIDWEQWTMDRLYRDLRTRYWGGVSRKAIVNIDLYREHKIRVCNECGSMLRTYDGLGDHDGQIVRYIADHPIVAFRNNADLVRQFFQRYKSKLRSGEVSKLELSRMIPVALCTKELDLERNNRDIVVDGPFSMPDGYYLGRQREAFGKDEEIVSA